MTEEFTIKEFFEALRTTKDQYTREIMRFQYDVAVRVRDVAQLNAKRIFAGKAGTPRSEITRRSWGNTARSSGATGALMRSIQVVGRPPGSVAVEAGGTGVPYAALHEFGGTVRPTKAKFLTVPFASKYVGRRAREFDLYFDIDPQFGRVLRPVTARVKRALKMVNTRGRNTDVAKLGSELDRNDSIAFLLLRSATIPARPYMGPAVIEVTKDDQVRAGLRRYFNRTSIPISVG